MRIIECWGLFWAVVWSPCSLHMYIYISISTSLYACVYIYIYVCTPTSPLKEPFQGNLETSTAAGLGLISVALDNLRVKACELAVDVALEELAREIQAFCDSTV